VKTLSVVLFSFLAGICLLSEAKMVEQTRPAVKNKTKVANQPEQETRTLVFTVSHLEMSAIPGPKGQPEMHKPAVVLNFAENLFGDPEDKETSALKGSLQRLGKLFIEAANKEPLIYQTAFVVVINQSLYLIPFDGEHPDAELIERQKLWVISQVERLYKVSLLNMTPMSFYELSLLSAGEALSFYPIFFTKSPS
jgi:hypothetical protein